MFDPIENQEFPLDAGLSGQYFPEITGGGVFSLKKYIFEPLCMKKNGSRFFRCAEQRN